MIDFYKTPNQNAQRQKDYVSLDSKMRQQTQNSNNELLGKHSINNHITKTYLYNFDPLKPNFYIVKLGCTGVYIIFLIASQKHRLWVLIRTALARQF